MRIQEANSRTKIFTLVRLAVFAEVLSLGLWEE